ncbi:TPA: restriction endonuclease [Stenotrophomonas maltophilia]|nr:restriction endonuclease [Stenotrophomonas maltophilia]HEL4204068.1 restriction endonuclease [Stenotrophomonas maltophilia]
MSELSHFEYAPPRSWEQFEELCADLFEAMWNDPASVRHGRAGQSQDGVDIVCARGAIRPIGIQCKKKSQWPVTRLTVQEIDEEVRKAELFSPRLEEFYILTTAPTDVKVQKHVHSLNATRRSQGVFTVVVLFWPEIVRRVARFDSVARKHFPVHGGVAASPLIATWYVSGGRIELSGMDWGLSAREAAEDFHDWPNGHVIVRRRETDAAMAELAAMPEGTNGASREQRLELRRVIRRLLSLESDVQETLRLICTDPDLSFYLRDLESSETDTADMIRAVIEYGFGSAAVDPRWQKLRIAPPSPLRLQGPLSERSVAHSDFPIFVPPETYAEILEKERGFQQQYGNRIVRVVSELPDEARKMYVFPALIARLRRIALEDQKTMEQLRFAGYLNLDEWKYER